MSTSSPPSRRYSLPLRARLATTVGGAAGRASRLAGRGDGSVIGGVIGLRLKPDLLSLLARGRQVVLVTGTNGKTTTTRLITAALGPLGQQIASNAFGANMEAGRSHPFHTHPTREELIYIISGRAEQWVGREHRILGPGETAFIPMGEPHGTFNPFRERLVFLAILAPSDAAEPGIVDVSTEEPWASIRDGFPPCT